MSKIKYSSWNKKGTHQTDRKEVGQIIVSVDATDNIYDATNKIVVDTLNDDGIKVETNEIRIYHSDGREWVGTFDELMNKLSN